MLLYKLLSYQMSLIKAVVLEPDMRHAISALDRIIQPAQTDET